MSEKGAGELIEKVNATLDALSAYLRAAKEDKEWLTQGEVAARLKVTPRAIRKMGIPSFVRGRTRRYRKADVDAYLEGAL